MKKLAFTLAEVLITLVIIGVIAAISIPILMNNSQGVENKAGYKKAIATLNHVLEIEYKFGGNTAATKDISEIFSERANVLGQVDTDNEDWADDTGSGATIHIKTPDSMIYMFPSTTTGSGCWGDTVDEDGEVVESIYGSGVKSCGLGAVDVNGIKGPNKHADNPKFPTDQFLFTIFETKVLPGDTKDSADGQAEVSIMYEGKK